MILPYLRLVRAGALFSPAADVLAGAAVWIATSRAVSATIEGDGGETVANPVLWTSELGRGMAASVLVYAAGMALNDHADRKEDAEQRPERPIPSGRIPAWAALLFGLVLLAGGIALAPRPLVWAALAGGVLAYDYVLKLRVPAAALGMGLLRGGNLLAGATVAALTTAGAEADFASRPVLAASLAYGAYIFAVTILGAFEDERQVADRAVDGVQTVPPIAAVLGLLALPERGPALWIGIALAVIFLRRIRVQRAAQGSAASDQAAIRGSMTWLLLGTMLYTGLLCLGAGYPFEAAGIGAAVFVARAISRRIMLT